MFVFDVVVSPVCFVCLLVPFDYLLVDFFVRWLFCLLCLCFPVIDVLLSKCLLGVFVGWGVCLFLCTLIGFFV